MSAVSITVEIELFSQASEYHCLTRGEIEVRIINTENARFKYREKNLRKEGGKKRMIGNGGFIRIVSEFFSLLLPFGRGQNFLF